MKKQDYIASRLIPQEEWFSRKATLNRKLFYFFSVISYLASLSIAALVQVDNCPRVVITCVTLLSSFALFLNHLLKSEKTWRLYRTISELLKTEKSHYEYSVGPYAQPGSKSDPRDVELTRRTELILLKAHEEWMQIRPPEDNEDHGGKKPRRNKGR